MSKEDGGLVVDLRQTGPIPLDLAITCARGELIALVGPSGAGKTTILRSIAGLYRPAGARIVCNGEVWADSSAGAFRPPHKRRVGLVFQSYALFPHMSAQANVEAAMSGRPSGDRIAAARELLALMGLEGLEGRKPAALSGGQQQRVAFARALAREPHLLLLDEPLSAVDRRSRRRLRDELARLRERTSIPIVLVTHDLDEAASLADRLLVIEGGRVLQSGPPADVLSSAASEHVRAALDLDAPGAGERPV